MAARDILRLGDPVLRVVCEPLDAESLESTGLQATLDDMIETMRAAKGVGLAAPQVGIASQIFVYETEPGTEGSPAAVAINPSVEPMPGELVYDWEGCLSIPDLRGLVPRHPAIRLFGLDRHGGVVDVELSGFVARVVQHEYDHLHGIVFLDRMRDLRSLSFEAEWCRFLADGEESAVG